MNILLFILIFGLGMVIGVMLAALFVRKSDVDQYENGYEDGFKSGKYGVLDNMDDLCSHCSYRGRMD